MSICSVLNSLYDRGQWNYRVMPGSKNNKNETFEKLIQDSILSSLVSRAGSEEWDAFIGGYISDYSDKKFAEQLQGGSGDKISTDRSINWQATGESVLTGAQIDYLKDNYDIENMSSQDYYNLIADLTNMNVISGKDVLKSRVSPAVMSNVLSNHSQGSGRYADENGEVCNFTGNLYGKILGRYDSVADTLALMNSGEYYGSAQGYLEIKEIYEEQMRVYGKFLDIFEKMS